MIKALLTLALIALAVPAMADHRGLPHRESWTISGVCFTSEDVHSFMGQGSNQLRGAAQRMLNRVARCIGQTITIRHGCLMETVEHDLGPWRLYRVTADKEGEGQPMYAALEVSHHFANEVEAWSSGDCDVPAGEPS